MAYERQVFVDQVKDADGNITTEGTTLRAAHLDHIEEGIVALEEMVETAGESISAALAEVALPTVAEEDDGKLLQVVGGVWSAVAITDGNSVAY